MAQKFIDLSGRLGLANRFYGNMNDTSSNPRRVYLGEDGQFADGIYNPIKNYGYLSPANNKYAAITGSINSRIIATEYDSINDDVYLAEAGNTIWRLDGLTDTSLTSAVVVNQSLTELITDLEIYELNGKRNLFYSYNITDGSSYYSKIGVLGLDSDSGIYATKLYDENNETIIDSIIGSGTNQKLAQAVYPVQTEYPITGSVDTSASTSVTGVGTLFLTELTVGDTIVVGNERRVVATITNDTSLTVTEAFTDQNNDTSIKKIPGIKFNKIAIPINKSATDNGGYTLKVSIQDATDRNQCLNSIDGDTEGRTTLDAPAKISDASQTGLDITDDISIECWVNFRSIGGESNSFVSKWRMDSGISAYWFGYIGPSGLGGGGTDANKLMLKKYIGGASNDSVSWSPSLNTWYHVAVTRHKASGEVKFYVDGQQIGQTAAGSTSALSNSAMSFAIAGCMSGSDTSNTNGFYTLDGKIDDVRVWNDVRTATEIRDNRTRQLIGNESNLVGYWKFNGNALDETSNNNDLTIASPWNSLDSTISPYDAEDVPFACLGKPDGSVDASATFSPSTVSTAGYGSAEKQSFVYLTLDTTVYKSQPFFIVLEPTVFGDMGSVDNVNWFGRTSNPDTVGYAAKYNGTYWEQTNAYGDDDEDFSYAVLLSEDQEWSNLRVTNPYKFKYNSDLFMCRADNGFMYIFEDNKVHKVDGTETGGASGTFTKEVLRFPSYFTTVDAIDTRGRMYIAVQANPSSGDEDARSYSEGITGVYTWDRQSAVVGARDFIPLYGVRDIKKLYVEPNGDVRAICIGDDKFVQIRSISSGYGKVIKTLGMSAYPETRDGLKVVNNMAIWLGADGIWYAHGRLSPTDSEQLYKIGDVTGETTGSFTTGAIFIGDSSSGSSRQAVIASFTDGSGSEVLRWYPHGEGTINTVAQTGNTGNVYTQVVPLPAMSTVKHIDINCFPTTSSGTTTIATIKTYFNQSTTPFKSKTVTQAEASRGYVSIECNKPYVSSVQIEIEFSSTETLGANDFNPMFAVVEYVPPADTVK